MSPVDPSEAAVIVPPSTTVSATASADSTVPPRRPQREPIEPIMYLLFFGTFLYALGAVLMGKDGQTFQFLCSLASGFSGALLGRVVPQQRNTHVSQTMDVKPTEPKP